MNIDQLCSQLGLVRGKGGVVEIPSVELAARAQALVAANAPLVFMYATDERATGAGFAVHAVFSIAGSGFLTLRSMLDAGAPAYPSLTRSIMAAHWYERLMGDQFGIVAEGHPDWRRLMHHENIPAGTYPLRKDFAWNTKLAQATEPYPMRQVEGKGIYEIPVGPIHAGVIEPGHFRFNVRGERILTLEGKLFFTHKGVEKLVERKTPEEAMRFVERISGDMVVGHALAYAEAIERAVGHTITPRAARLRVVWSELERISGHVFDIGNMAGNGTGFTFMAAQGFRMLEELRRLYESLVGHRYLRGAIVLGGAHDIAEEAQVQLRSQLEKTERELATILDIAFRSDGLMERFETTGVLLQAAARAYGARGIGARGSNIPADVRRDHPYAAYAELPFEVVTEPAGDVAARFKVRAREVAQSLSLIRATFASMPEGSAESAVAITQGNGLGWAESFRGAVIDFVRLDAQGKLDRLAVSDPSFMNWPLFGELGPGNIVPDFPLCNKSLSLSYSGTDL